MTIHAFTNSPRNVNTFNQKNVDSETVNGLLTAFKTYERLASFLSHHSAKKNASNKTILKLFSTVIETANVSAMCNAVAEIQNFMDKKQKNRSQTLARVHRFREKKRGLNLIVSDDSVKLGCNASVTHPVTQGVTLVQPIESKEKTSCNSATCEHESESLISKNDECNAPCNASVTPPVTHCNSIFETLKNQALTNSEKTLFSGVEIFCRKIVLDTTFFLPPLLYISPPRKELPAVNKSRLSTSKEVRDFKPSLYMRTVYTNTSRARIIECELKREIKSKIFSFWKKNLGSERSTFGTYYEQAVCNALEWGFEYEDLKKAILGVRHNPRLMGENPSKQKYVGLGTIFKSPDMIEGLIDLYERNKPQKIQSNQNSRPVLPTETVTPQPIPTETKEWMRSFIGSS